MRCPPPSFILINQSTSPRRRVRQPARPGPATLFTHTQTHISSFYPSLCDGSLQSSLSVVCVCCYVLQQYFPRLQITLNLLEPPSTLHLLLVVCLFLPASRSHPFVSCVLSVRPFFLNFAIVKKLRSASSGFLFNKFVSQFFINCTQFFLFYDICFSFFKFKFKKSSIKY